MELTDTQRAVRLLYKGMKPEASATRDLEYADLIARWEADPAFREIVRSHAPMLDVVVMEVTARQIVLRPAGQDSAFRRPLSDVLQNHVERRGLYALALVAVGAAFFRTGRHLTDRPDALPLTLDHLEEILTELCQAVETRAGGKDPRADEGEVESWRVFLGLIRQAEGEVRGGFSSRTAVLRQIVNLLVKQSMLREEGAGASRSYVPTERFRLQMRDVMSNELYRDCISLLDSDAAPETVHA